MALAAGSMLNPISAPAIQADLYRRNGLARMEISHTLTLLQLAYEGCFCTRQIQKDSDAAGWEARRGGCMAKDNMQDLGSKRWRTERLLSLAYPSLKVTYRLFAVLLVWFGLSGGKLLL